MIHTGKGDTFSNRSAVLKENSWSFEPSQPLEITSGLKRKTDHYPHSQKDDTFTAGCIKGK